MTKVGWHRLPLSFARIRVGLIADIWPQQFCRWWEGMIDLMTESQAKWSARDYSEILLSTVLAKNTDFGIQKGALSTVSRFLFLASLPR